MRKKRLLLKGALALAASQPVFAAPGDIIFEDDFESGLSATDWTVNATSATGEAGTNAYLVTTGDSMFTRHDEVTVTSNAFDLSALGGANLSMVLEKGADIANSEDPDADDEDLVLEYLDSDDTTWVALVLLDAQDMAEEEQVVYDAALPSAALHDSFRFRLRQTGGTGNTYDYWHVDDVELLETTGVVVPPPVLSANSCDYFENGLGNWTTSGAGASGTNSATFNSPSNSMFLSEDTVTVTSDVFDATNLSAIDVWIRKGDNSFSNNPNGGEDLIFEYSDNAGAVWNTLDTFVSIGGMSMGMAGVTPGEIVEPTWTTPVDFSVSSSFQVRFTLVSGSGAGEDFWHIDDLCFSGGSPLYTMLKTASVESDPVYGTATDAIPGDNPKAIPNATVLYSVIASNSGSGSADEDTVTISDMLSDDTDFYLGDLDGAGSPFIFTDGVGANTSGLAYDFISPTSGADEVVFLDDMGNEITPATGVDYDPNVRGFRVTMLGQFYPANTGTPSFTLTYRVRLN